MKIKALNNREVYWKPNFVNWDKPSKSKFQTECKLMLSLVWKGDAVAEEQNMPCSRLSMDFVNFTKKIIIECDGEQHRKFNKFFHNRNIFNFEASLKRDEKKDRFATLNGFQLIRIKSPEDLKKILSQL